MSRIAKFGSYASIACLIHCLAFPILIALLPAIGFGFLLSHWSEFLVMTIAIICSGIDLCWGLKRHKNFYPITIFTSGILWYKLGHDTNHNVLFLVVGCLSFVVSNILNKKMCNSCSKCHH